MLNVARYASHIFSEITIGYAFRQETFCLIYFEVKTPMILKVDNKGACDLANNWSSAGRTRHVAIRVNFLRELKEQGDLLVQWIPNKEMSSNIFTKHVGGTDFQRHSNSCIG